MLKKQIKNWSFKLDNHDREYKAQSPCTLYSILKQHNVIEDPYIKENENQSTKLSEHNCQFSSTFNLTEDIFSYKNIILQLNGIDTLCTIYINGYELAKTKNFFRTYELDCKNLLVLGENRIDLKILSPLKHVREEHKKFPLWNMDAIENGVSHIRKPAFSFGWDWAPNLPDMGILGEVNLIAYNNRIAQVDFIQNHDANAVNLSITVTCKGDDDKRIEISIYDDKTLIARSNCINGKCEITIPNPKLWWPRGYGNQPLYKVNTSLFVGYELIDEVEHNIGLRTIDISCKPDDLGAEFSIIVNNIKIFAMGASYVPLDSILSDITPDRTEKLLQQCIDMNFNCIRVWGGGCYVDDTFYDFCDKNGLLVWQDFMVACENITLKNGFLEEFTEELICNVNKIKHHASLALFCGNNEMEDFVIGKGSQQETIDDYLMLYENIFPKIMKDIAPQVYYWPSSPSTGGNFYETNNCAYADCHYWRIWFLDKDYDYYKNDVIRFCSEFGFQSLPSIKTIKQYSQDINPSFDSPIVLSHQKCKVSGEKTIKHYIDTYYKRPYDFEEEIYLSQLNQAYSTKYGVDYMRSKRGISTGALFWQLNDSWPSISWSAIDYYGRFKALYYFTKRFFSPITTSSFLNDNILSISVSNESLTNFIGELEYSILDNNFNCYHNNKIQVEINKFSSKEIVNENIEKHITGYENCRFAYICLKDISGNIVYQDTLLFVKPKFYNFAKADIKYTFDYIDTNKYQLNIYSNVYVQDLMIDFSFADVDISDNFVCIPNKQISLTINSSLSKNELKNNVKFLCVNNLKTI